MLTILVDDIRSFTDERAAIVCRTVDAAIETLMDVVCADNGVAVDELWLDHDLGFNGGNIFDLVSLLEEDAQNLDHPPALTIRKIYIHTANPVGRERMLAALLRSGYDAVAINADWEGILHG